MDKSGEHCAKKNKPNLIKKNIAWYHLLEESKIIIEAESRMVFTKDWGEKKIRSVAQNAQNFSYAGWLSSGGLMYGMMTAVNNTMFYIWNLT